MDNSSHSERRPFNPYASLNTQELTDRLRQAFEREYERRNTVRRHRRNRSQSTNQIAANQPASNNQQNQPEASSPEGHFYPLTRPAARHIQRHINLTGKLLISAILIAKENNPEGTATQIWEAFVHKLQTTPLFNSETQVLQAWWYVFNAPHRPIFDPIVTGPIDETYQKIAQLELP